MGERRTFRANVLPFAVGTLSLAGFRRITITSDSITYHTVSGEHQIERSRVADAVWRPMWRSLTFQDAAGHQIGHSLGPNDPTEARRALVELGWPAGYEATDG